jgi:hypothetical protein
MDPIQEKLTKDYFLEKIEVLIKQDLDKQNIKIRKTHGLLESLSGYIDSKSIINNHFWGYGIGVVSNGVKTIKKGDNPKAYFLLTLFTVEKVDIVFSYLSLSYGNWTVREILKMKKVPIKHISRVTWSTSPSFGIYSALLDNPIIIETDEIQHAKYYASRIDRFTKIPGTVNEVPFKDKAKKVLQELRNMPKNRGELKSILKKLDLSYLDSEMKDFKEYFEAKKYARVTLSKDDCPIVLTGIGSDFVQRLSSDMSDHLAQPDLEDDSTKKDRIRSGHVSPATNPMSQKPKAKKKYINDDIKWVIGTVLTFGILYVGVLNYELNNRHTNIEDVDAIQADTNAFNNDDSIKVKQ